MALFLRVFATSVIIALTGISLLCIWTVEIVIK